MTKLRRSVPCVARTRRVDLPFAGPFDLRSAHALESAASRCRRSLGTLGCAVAHIDLDGVTALDHRGLDALNRTWHLLTRRGWTVLVSAPDAPEARTVFVRAAVCGDLAWARGTRGPSRTAQQQTS